MTGIAACALLLSTSVAVSAQAADAPPPASQQYRPLVHYTPTTNWMNDPNGLVYVDGTYHLFYQHNPSGTRWGNMSWGHATSDDLVHWVEQPLAIPQTLNDQGQSVEDIFSGSVVADVDNTSGFGAPGGPTPLVAIYTSAYTDKNPTYAGIQAQSLAYSLDHGQTWTKYGGNPVLNRNSANFRDPKVSWYDGPAGKYWVMVAVEATDHKVVISKSTDLKTWTHLSDFGPANAVGGQWECPDLFPLPVDGDPTRTKWVMVVNLNPGGPNQGSAGQYFVGDFDGTTFTSETTDGPGALPAGTTFADFENGSYDGWTVNNEPGNRFNGPWGSAPATGALDGQSPVTGFVGSGLVNSFMDHDWAVGTLQSPTFTITDDYVNFLVSGGKHPHVPDSQLTNNPPAGRTLFDFELPDGQNLAGSGWTLTGDFATDPNRNPSTAGGDYYLGAKRINTFEGGPRGDDNTGDMTSPAFTLDGSYVSFLIGGGHRDDGSLEAELIVDGAVVRTAMGKDDGALNWASWHVQDYAGKQAQIRIHDGATGGWGHLTFDNVVIGDEPAQVRSDETAVNLIVDGKVVRTATGANSENLDWASWNVRQFRGKQASIQVVDNNRFGWGHILLDQVMFGDTSAASALDGYDWLDHGRDYYAGISYGGTPANGTRIMQAWMNDWDYAENIPTSTWRSSMALPREVNLVSTPDGPRLSQRVAPQVDALLDQPNAQTRSAVAVNGATDLGLSGEVAKVHVVLNPGAATRAGITVFGDGGSGSGTKIGYDTTQGRLFLDRTNSGNVGFDSRFPSVDGAPVSLQSDGKIALDLYLDRASVELFTADGRTSLTDQVFPNAGATAISAWSEGGTATIDSITVTPLTQSMFVNHPAPRAFATVDRRTVSLTATATDTRIARIEYSVNNGAWQQYSAPFAVDGDQSVPVAFRATDLRGATSSPVAVTVAATRVGADAVLKPFGATKTILTGQATNGFAAQIVDGNGGGVLGTDITFTLTGGTFAHGATTAVATTNAAGIAIAPAASSSTPGTMSVTAVGAGQSMTLPTVAVVAPVPTLSAESTAESKIVSGKVSVQVTARNTGANPVTIKLLTKYGSKTFTAVAPGASVTNEFKTYLASIPAGEATISLSDASGTAITTTPYASR